MTIPQIARQLGAAVGLLALAVAASGASAAEKLVDTYGEQRTVLSFKVPDATAQKLLPEGWQASAATAGPSKDANLNVVFVDVLSVQNPDGTQGETYRYAVLTVPAKKKGTDATVPMVVTGLSTPPNVPGAYGNYALAMQPWTDMSTPTPPGRQTSRSRGNSGATAALRSSFNCNSFAGLRPGARRSSCPIRGSSRTSIKFTGSSKPRM